MNTHIRSRLYHAGIIREIDFHFARFISGLCPHDDPDIFMGAALVSNAAGNGDIYLDLALSAGKPLGESLGDASRLRCPELNVWTEKLHASPVVGSPGELRPLILDKKNRLYLYRYWDYEKKLAEVGVQIVYLPYTEIVTTTDIKENIAKQTSICSNPHPEKKPIGK